MGPIIIYLTNSPYWDFWSTLGATLFSVAATWIFAWIFYKRASIESRKINVLLLEELSKRLGRPVSINFNKKGEPTLVISGGSTATIGISATGGGEVVEKEEN